jgi:hypothetical protein
MSFSLHFADHTKDRRPSQQPLADDAEAGLAGAPLSLYPDSWLARMVRWSRKHRRLVTNAAAMLVLGTACAIAFVTVSIVNNREPPKQSGPSDAREPMAIAARGPDLLGDGVEEEQAPVNSPVVTDLQKGPLEFFKSLRDQFQADSETNPIAPGNASAIEPQRHAAGSQIAIAVKQIEAGHPDWALESYTKALAVFERVAREHPGNAVCQNDLAQSHFAVAVLHGVAGNPDRSLVSYGNARAIWEQLANEHSEAPDFATNLGATLNSMATIDLAAKRFQQAREKLSEAVRWQKKAMAANPLNPTCRRFLRNYLLNLLKAANGLRDALDAVAVQLELDELAGSDPANGAQ